MKLVVYQQDFIEVSCCIKASQYKCGCIDIIERVDGMQEKVC